MFLFVLVAVRSCSWACPQQVEYLQRFTGSTRGIQGQAREADPRLFVMRFNPLLLCLDQSLAALASVSRGRAKCHVTELQSERFHWRQETHAFVCSWACLFNLLNSTCRFCMRFCGSGLCIIDKTNARFSDHNSIMGPGGQAWHKSTVCIGADDSERAMSVLQHGGLTDMSLSRFFIVYALQAVPAIVQEDHYLVTRLGTSQNQAV